MVSKGDKWVRIFDVPETNNHKKGFTIYKVISLLYPEICPDAITKITVWKRYNEFKKLQREVKSLHKMLKIKEKMPMLPNAPFFKRFDLEIVEERRLSILNFLEFTATQPKIFTANVFVKFFQTSHTPVDMLQSNINEIRAELSLPTEIDYFPTNAHSSDDERTLSDTDSVCTLSSVSTNATDLLSDPLYKSTSSLTRLSKKSSSEFADNMSLNVVFDTIPENNFFPTPPPTPNCDNATSQYILDASKHITLAIQLESQKQYEQSFKEYKTGIDVLLKNVKLDKNIDRKEMVRFKIEKYLLRAEKIYNMYLSSEIRNINQFVTNDTHVEYKPLSDLFKYKVVKVISSGMVALHSESQKMVYVKVLQKTTLFNNDHLILPEHVPYMVKLHNFYNCENALFLVLQYCSGFKLRDHINQTSTYATNSEKQLIKNQFSSKYDQKDSDNDSNYSYSDLIHDYRQNKSSEATSIDNLPPKEVENSLSDDNLNDFEVVSICEQPVDIIETEEANSIDVEGLVEKSQKLLSNIDITLRRKYENVKPVIRKVKKSTTTKEIINDKPLNRQSSDYFDEFDDLECYPLAQIEDIVKWASQIVIALEKLHILNVICYDLNMNKLLVDADNDIVITYKCTTADVVNVHNFKNDICLAPELYSLSRVSYSADWWSLGIILYELLVGIPFQEVHSEILTTHSCVKIPKSIFAEGRSILKQLLCFDPKDRLGAGTNGTEDVKSHPFFSGVDWDKLHSKYVL